MGNGCNYPGGDVSPLAAGREYGAGLSNLLPTPLSIARAFTDLLVTGELTHHLGVSMGRAGIGFLIGGVLGLLFGVLTGLFRSVEYVLDPSVQVLRLVPHLAIAPLIILWFGFGEISKVVIIMTGSFFRSILIRLWASAMWTINCSK